LGKDRIWKEAEQKADDIAHKIVKGVFLPLFNSDISKETADYIKGLYDKYIDFEKLSSNEEYKNYITKKMSDNSSDIKKQCDEIFQNYEEKISSKITEEKYTEEMSKCPNRFDNLDYDDLQSDVFF
jgi:hypothetical protein